ncbi:MAG TPA: VOC family protein [Candidatus Acidoferrales bacterium]|nr:VOC family protein [Candidatus Acidoferrales bacterium]
MANIEKHKPGSFCWIELGTSDQGAAKEFYGGLFGWAPDDNPMGPDEFYTIFKIDGRQAGAAYTLRKEEREHGVPPHWNLYVATESADATAKRAEELGAKVLAPPFDVFDAGRMAVIQDPTGAAFCLWEAKKHVGATIAGVPGTICAADLITQDQDAASDFYEKLFGWQIGKEDEEPGHRYYHIFNGGEFMGGIPPASFAPKGVPPHWQIYLQVADCGASVAKAKELGARIYMPKMKVEDVGWMAIVADPQGASFALFQMAAATKAVTSEK